MRYRRGCLPRLALEESADVAGDGQHSGVAWIKLYGSIGEYCRISRHVGDVLGPALADQEGVPISAPSMRGSVFRFESNGTSQIAAGLGEGCSIHSLAQR